MVDVLIPARTTRHTVAPLTFSSHALTPKGMNKMVINHLERLFVTSDTSTIVTELEVAHPAANLIVMAAKAQEAEIGDGTNLVVSLAGELLDNAGALLREGLHTTEIAEGYEKASFKALEILETLIIPGTEKIDVFDASAVRSLQAVALSSSIILSLHPG
jgi:T-complex protein 1 subunit theta